MAEGWKRDDDGILKINPNIYCESYLGAFGPGGKIWQYDSFLTKDELERVKQRIIKKYINR